MNTTRRTILIAVPVLLIAVTIMYFTIVKPWQDSQTEMVTFGQTIINDDIGLQFTYPSGADGLSLIEPAVDEGLLQAAYILMPTTDYIAFQSTSTPQGTEAPPSISIFVFAAPDSATSSPELSREDRLRAWATQNQQLTSYTRATSEIATTTIDGLNMLTYTADGLYPQNIYLGLYRGNIYMFVGQSNSAEDPLNVRFAELLGTVLFD